VTTPRRCSCGGIDIGVGVMHEPDCELNDAGVIARLEQENEALRERVAALEAAIYAHRQGHVAAHAYVCRDDSALWRVIEVTP
jgi:hypothetical protein